MKIALGFSGTLAGLVALLALTAAGPAGDAAGSRPILALEMQRSLGTAGAAASLKSFLDGPNEALAVRAALAIGRTKRGEVVTLLEAHLADPRVPVRAMSVYAMGLVANGQRAESLIAATRDASGAVRVAAIDALERYEAAHVLAAR